jgi:hypothetical protein
VPKTRPKNLAARITPASSISVTELAAKYAMLARR